MLGDYKDPKQSYQVASLQLPLRSPVVDQPLLQSFEAARTICRLPRPLRLEPEVADEPEWMKLSTVLPSSPNTHAPMLCARTSSQNRSVMLTKERLQVLGLKAGGVVFRDLRAWCDADRL